MSLDTVCDLASLTTPLDTAPMVQHLADAGRLDLYDSAARHEPELATNGKASVTVLQLLLHTSGLPIFIALRQYEKVSREALRRVFRLAPEHAAGERYVYSDAGYIALGGLIEAVAGEPLDELARRVIFEPLSLRDTLFRPGPELRERVAPTEIAEERPVPLIHGEVHDPRAYLLGGVAGNAGLFSTGADLAKIARLLLSGGALEGRRVLSRLAVQEFTRPRAVPGAQRTAGWDMTSPYSGSRGARLSARAYGHGGYTGTSLWIDPLRDLFVIVLTNRVHPHPEHSVVSLQGSIADAAVAAVEPDAPPCDRPPPRALAGVDALRARGFEPLAGRRVVLVTHRAATTSDGTPTLDLIAGAPGVKLLAVLSPEHGLAARAEGAIADSRDARTDLPVYSLYGKTQRPTRAMLRDAELVVVDLVDVGTRYYTYMSTLHQVLIAAAQARIPVVVLDRPNPIGGVAVEGPVLDAGIESFVNYHPLPVRHGMTAGELAELLNEERHIGARLEVVRAEGWHRALLHADTGLPWKNPSPNLRSPEAAVLYPAVGLLESTNVSVGRGTEQPFSVIGAPYIDADALDAALSHARLPGLEHRPTHFVPDANPHRGEACHGVVLRVTDPVMFRPVRTALVLARALRERHADQWHSHKLMRIWGSARVVEGLLGSESIDRLEQLWQPRLQEFRKRRAPFLLYPECAAPPITPTAR
jgi:uncharacterized protein YbbC (DUF1343 family)